MSKILVPTDFSATARNAIAYAIRMVKQVDAGLVIFHANDPASVRSDEEVQAAMDQLRLEIEPGLFGLRSIDYSARHGKLKDLLPVVAAEFNVDLVLMGTNGVSGGDPFRWGSNAYSVIEDSQVPVLVVPPEADFHGIQRLALAVDYRSDFSQLPVIPLIKTLQLTGGEVFVLSILPTTSENPPEAVMDVRMVGTLLKNVPHSFHYVYADNTEKAIVDFAKLQFVDVVIVLPKKHSWFKKLFNTSHTQNLVFQIATPVLAIGE